MDKSIDDLIKEELKTRQKLSDSYQRNIAKTTQDKKYISNILKQLDNCEHSLLMLERLKRIFQTYQGKNPIYPMQGEDLLVMIKLLKKLKIEYETVEQNKSPVPIDETIWSTGNTLLIFEIKKKLGDSWQFLK